MKHLVYLITGIVLTIVFFVLATGSAFNIYERLYYSQGFNDALYNHNMYPTMALITIAITWGAAAIYYYAINSVKFDRWYHWLAWCPSPAMPITTPSLQAPGWATSARASSSSFRTCCGPPCCLSSHRSPCAGGAATAGTHLSRNNTPHLTT